MDGTDEAGPGGVDDDPLFAVLEIVERQQAATQAVLDGLAAERAALRQERDALARQVQALQAGVQGAVRAAVADSLAGAATKGTEAVQAATRPLLDRVAGVTQEASQAEVALRRVVLWASWRLLGWVMALGTAVVVFGWLTSSGVLWWDTGAIAAARLRKAELQAEVAEMQANRDDWAKTGMLGKLTRCGPKSRPCIRVDESAGAFESQGHSDYRVIQGY